MLPRQLSQIVRICYRRSQEPTFLVVSKSGQYQLDIADVEFLVVVVGGVLKPFSHKTQI